MQILCDAKDFERLNAKWNPKDRVGQAAIKNEGNTMGLPIAVQIASFSNRKDIVQSVMKKLETVAEMRKDYPVNVVLKALFCK